MAKLTPQACLSPRTAPPDLPPWQTINVRELQAWLGVSANTVYTWNCRGNGPRRSISKERLVTFVLADVLEWIDGTPAHEHIRSWLMAPERAAVAKAFKSIPSMDADELAAFCALLDRVRVFPPAWARTGA